MLRPAARVWWVQKRHANGVSGEGAGQVGASLAWGASGQKQIPQIPTLVDPSDQHYPDVVTQYGSSHHPGGHITSPQTQILEASFDLVTPKKVPDFRKPPENGNHHTRLLDCSHERRNRELWTPSSSEMA